MRKVKHVLIGAMAAGMILTACPTAVFADEPASANEQLSVEDYSLDASAASLKNGLVYEGGVFKYYENNVWITSKYGFVEFDGGKFLIANGVVATNINGLAQDPEDKSIWYYCAGGQVQNQYSGLAQYDGAWFYLTNGKLDTTFSGLVDYDGGKFIVAAGQIQTQVNGLWQNSKALGGDDTWYFFSNGQAQTEYTGLVLYDCTWFFICDGYFSQTATGYYEQDGRIYYIENGVMKEDCGEGNMTEKEPNSSKATATALRDGYVCDSELGSYTKYLKDGEDVDWYSFECVEGQVYYLEVIGWCDKFANTSALMTIVNPVNDVNYLNYDLESLGQDYLYFEALYTGTYYIRIWNFTDYSDSGKDWTYEIWYTVAEEE